MRRGIFTVTGPALQWLMGMPEGTQIIDIQWNHQRSIATVVVDHPEISETPEGDLKPLAPAITTKEDGTRIWEWEPSEADERKAEENEIVDAEDVESVESVEDTEPTAA